MKTKDFLKENDAYCEGARWALSISDNMGEVWDAMIEHEIYEWLLWTIIRPGVFPDSVLRKLACRFVRETPLEDGRKVWDLLIDERSRKAVEVAELYADGKATGEELDTAAHAARAAYAERVTGEAYAAYAVAVRVVEFAVYTAAIRAATAAYVIADRTAYAVAKLAQIRMIGELGNPFKEERSRQ